MSTTPSPVEDPPAAAVPFAGCHGPVSRARGRSGPASAMPVERAALRCRLAREIASAVLSVSVDEIARPNRSFAEACRARHLAIYLSHVVFQVPLSAIAVHFGRDRTSVAHAVRRIEDARDDDGFEQLVARLERLADACLGLSTEGARA